MLRNNPKSEISLQSIDHALDILEAVAAEHTSLSLSRLQELTGLHKSTVYRTVISLCKRGYLEKDLHTGHYGMGMQVIRIASSRINDLELVTEARPILMRAYQQVNLTVQLSILEGVEVVYLDEIDGLSGRRFSTMGFQAPACTSSAGKCLLAALSGEELKRRFAHYSFVKSTSKSIENFEQLHRQLQQVRKRGWATNENEYAENLSSIGAPIYDYNGDVVAAICFGGNSIHFLPENIAQLSVIVLDTALSVSKKLGYLP